MHDQDEIRLQQQLSQGSEKAFEEVFQAYFKVLTVFSKKFVQDLSVAEDLVQEVLLKLYENRRSIQFHTSLKAFLFQSVRNKSIDYLRSLKSKSDHHDQFKLLSVAESADWNDTMEQSELEERIAKAISVLPDQCQLIFKMSRFDGKRNQEIAEELDISKRTVETQVSNALKRLRKDVLPYVNLLIIILSRLF
ncbi:RNA polymerase sigma-70 factor [Roseivirga sp. 4D4]|uniref:RNA polymerase sigma-70 factor n=1 Tax=Roseivirga sp. 4D4 TaxID=1889784 RepID=UPI00147AE2B2|nr:RNA polymerase sigma-70 factor [Roseivirga sp. 4D4]